MYHVERGVSFCLNLTAFPSVEWMQAVNAPASTQKACTGLTQSYHGYNFSETFPIIWASTRENLSSVGCEQQRRSLVSAFVSHLLENTIFKHASSEILIF